MKEIKKYTSIIRYGKPDTLNVLNKGDFISITEKIDGANASFRIDEENPLGVSCYSREHPLREGELTLNGFWGWVKDNIVPIKSNLNPNYIYYGEWLYSHHVRYKEEYYTKFYLFSIWDVENEEYLSDEIVVLEAKRLGLLTVPYLYVGEFISIDHIMSFVGKSYMSYIDDNGEGIVVKNIKYRRRDGRQLFIKILNEKFDELMKQKAPRVPKIDYILRDKLMSVLTKNRLRKLLFKLIEEGELKEDYNIKDMGIILRLLGNSAYDDIMKEEADLFEGFDENQIRKMIGKNMPPIVREIVSEKEDV